MPNVQQVVTVSRRGSIGIVTLNRPDKHNAISEELMRSLHDAFKIMDEDVRAIVLYGAGPSFCAGLDLSEHRHREPFQSVLFARYGHEVFNTIQFGGRPVIAALHGAVVGGGLEMACCAHVRVADETVFYQLPEARRGIYVGGGASVRVTRIIGSGRLVEMMLTGRKYGAAAGERLGFSHYVVAAGKALDKAMELAELVAENAVIPNYLIVQAIPRIENMSSEEGLFAESIAQAVSLTSNDAKRGIDAFLCRGKTGG